MFRKSCEKCHFCNTKRPSDITIADFWGWEKTNKDFNADDKGCSLILINTEKGKKLFDNIKDRMNIISADLEKCIQPNMKYPSPPSRNRNKFEQEYSKYGFEYVYYKYNTAKNINNTYYYYYSDNNLTNAISKVTPPSKTGYTFKGY